MKGMILCAALLLTMAASAQTKTGTKKAAAGKSAAVNNKTSASTTTLASESSYAARAGLSYATADSASQNLFIADPVISALNAKARGQSTVPSLQIVGLHKNAYGFAHGRLRLTPTGSTSSGGTTGLGGVATGNGLGAVGSSPGMPGVNGKSPDAGSAMWGNARNLIIRTDSTRKQ
jgi:hypothetical protein